MSRQIDVLAVESNLYGIYKATYSVMGDSSASLMRKIAPEILNMFEKLGFDFSGTDNLEGIEMKFSEPTVNLYDDGKRTTVCLNETFKGIEKDGITTEEIISGDIFELIKTTAGWKITSWYRDIYMRQIPRGGAEKE